MMKSYRIFASIFVALFCAGCSGITAKTSYNKDLDFSTLKNYAWINKTIRYTDPRLNSPDLKRRITSSVNSEMTKRGFNMVTSSDADFLVRYDVKIEPRGKLSNLASDSVREEGTGVFLSEQTAPHLSERNQGSLILDFVTPKNNKVLWSGTAKAVVDINDSAGKKEARVLKAVQKLLRKFPAKHS